MPRVWTMGLARSPIIEILLLRLGKDRVDGVLELRYDVFWCRVSVPDRLQRVVHRGVELEESEVPGLVERHDVLHGNDPGVEEAPVFLLRTWICPDVRTRAPEGVDQGVLNAAFLVGQELDELERF